MLSTLASSLQLLTMSLPFRNGLNLFANTKTKEHRQLNKKKQPRPLLPDKIQ